MKIGTKVAQAFARANTATVVEEAIEQHLAVIREATKTRCNKESCGEHCTRDHKAEGASVVDAILPSVRAHAARIRSSRLQHFLFWMGDWWYYHKELRGAAKTESNPVVDSARALTQALVAPALPKEILAIVEGAKLLNVAVGYGHFAILYGDWDAATRWVVTDTEVFQMEDVRGYSYLDILPNGNPVTRCVTCHGGGRAFFDGVRLMAHDRFQTCAPKVVVIRGGYKVNSTHCTIVDGKLFELIDEDDRVAHTDGAFMGMVDWTVTEGIDAMRIAERSGSEMHIEGDRVYRNGSELTPIGAFLPSTMERLASGALRVSWSRFESRA